METGAALIRTQAPESSRHGEPQRSWLLRGAHQVVHLGLLWVVWGRLALGELDLALDLRSEVAN
jgi:hypothetical protein